MASRLVADAPTTSASRMAESFGRSTVCDERPATSIGTTIMPNMINIITASRLSSGLSRMMAGRPGLTGLPLN